MIGGQLILDGIQYKVGEGTVPETDATGQPTGRMLAIKALLIKDAHSGLTVGVRMTPEQFDDFAAALSGRKVVVPWNGFKLPGSM